MKHIWVLIALTLFSFCSSFAADSKSKSSEGDAPKVRVLDIHIEALGGRLTVDSSMVIKQSGLLPGMYVTGDDVQEGIRSLWKLKLFSDIEIVKERETGDGWYLVIKVREYPRMENWKISGAKKIKVDDIRDKVKLNRGQTLRDVDIFRANKIIREMYAEEGYLSVEIDTKIVDGTLPTTKCLETTIQEHKKIRIAKIEFVSSDGSKLPFSQGKLRKQFKDTKQRIFVFRTGKFDKSQFEDDKKLVAAFFRNHGYRDGQVIKDTIEYAKNGKSLSIKVTVDPGPLYYFGDVTFTGNSIFTDDELKSKIDVRRGDKFAEEKLDIGVTEAIRGSYLDKGYLAAQIQPTLIPVAGSKQIDTLNVKIEIGEGAEFKVRRIDISGNTTTKDHVIRREIVQLPGETFDRSKLQRSVRELTILNFFSNVEPQVLPAGEKEVDLKLDVTEKQTSQANMQVGYSQRDGAIGSIGFTMPNFMGNGQRFSFDWSFGSYYRNFSISFDEPYLTYPQTSIGGTLYSQRRGGSYYGFDELQNGGSFRLGRRLTWPDDYCKVNYNYTLERAVYTNFTSDFIANNINSLEEDKPRLSSTLTQVLTRDSRDNPEFPTTGSVQTIGLTWSGGFLGGNDRYYKTTISSEWYQHAFLKFVLYSSTEAGMMNGLSGNPRDIPYVDYFFMGGSGLGLGVPLRGYNERAIGPQTRSGDYAIGGKSYFKQALELRVPIVPNPTIYGLMFAEAGNVWISPIDLNPGNLKRSAGLGVRIFMPMVGLIGLDYAYGFDNSDSKGNRQGEWMPHFQFGRGF